MSNTSLLQHPQPLTIGGPSQRMFSLGLQLLSMATAAKMAVVAPPALTAPHVRVAALG